MLILAVNWLDQRCAVRARRFARQCSEALAVPTYFLELLILIEDKRFPRHVGVDPIGIVRAFKHNLRAGDCIQGASTLAQQLYGIRKACQHRSPRLRTLGTKLIQVSFGLWISCRQTKAAILSEYLQGVYWGENFRGIDDAAGGYFGKQRQALTVEESFFLIERLASPNRSSRKHVSVILRRKSIVQILKQNGSSIDDLKTFYKLRGCVF